MSQAEQLETTSWNGLTSVEAAARLAAEGPNELPRAQRRSPLRIAGEVLREPMLALLLGGAVLYLILGDHGEALILGVFAGFSITVTIVQEVRTEHVLEALRDISAPRALVLRDGVQIRVTGRDVVRGDLLLLQQGDRIAADAELVDADTLEVDESLLTGESLPVAKSARAAAGTTATDDSRRIFSGSLVTHGNAMARVVATGHASRIGQIGQSLVALETEAPRLRREMAVVVRLCALGGAVAALAVVLLYGLLRGGWVEALLAGIAIGMSLLPEEFPVVLTVFLAMGAWRIGQARVLTRRAAAIEALGSATVLCTDKTGTLTENRMRVAELSTGSTGPLAFTATEEMPEAYRELVRNAIQASAPVPVDPMEVALQAAGRGTAAASGTWPLVRTHGLAPDLMVITNVWETGEKGVLHIAAKGAPEAIAKLCHLSGADREAMMQAVQAMAAKGIRVLGVAAAQTRDMPPAPSPCDYDLSLIGLVGLADPLRPAVPLAVERCRAAGIRVVMITGDHAATARSIAREAGLAEGDVMTGSELAALDDAALQARLPRVSVFARIQPEQKLRIVTALKQAGEIVAMTGDGVNDAPSLKAAHIGIAMGARGTDVAREAAAIVLLDDDFGAIVEAVRLGRRIYDNIRKAIAFIFAVHVPIAGLALLPLLLGLPILLAPIHIALLEMIIDPVCALVFEAEREEADVMRRAPRRPDERLLTLPIVVWSIFQGGLAFVLLGALFVVATATGVPAPEVRGLTFFALIASILALILVNRSFNSSIRDAFARHNIALRYVLSVLGLILGAILAIPGVMHLFGFIPLSLLDLAVTGLTGLVLLGILEATKIMVPGLLARTGRAAIART